MTKDKDSRVLRRTPYPRDVQKSCLVRVQTDFPSPAPPGCFGYGFPFGHKCLGIARCGQSSATTGRNNTEPMAERQFLPPTHQSLSARQQQKINTSDDKGGVSDWGTLLWFVCLSRTPPSFSSFLRGFICPLFYFSNFLSFVAHVQSIISS